jgi:threonine/homoserine/homoserine lactone efflux protein
MENPAGNPGDSSMITQLLALLLFLFPLAYSPGPGNMFFAANGARFGLPATLPASAGYHVATWLVTLAIGLGFSAALERSPHLFSVIKWAGSAYVLYLAWKLFRAGAIKSKGEARPAGFRDGVILLALNPKAYVIIALMFSQFLTAETEHRLAAVLFITTVFTLNNLVAFTAWTAVGDRIARQFQDEAHAHRMNMALGAILAAVAVWMLFA